MTICPNCGFSNPDGNPWRDSCGYEIPANARAKEGHCVPAAEESAKSLFGIVGESEKRNDVSGQTNGIAGDVRKHVSGSVCDQMTRITSSGGTECYGLS